MKKFLVIGLGRFGMSIVNTLAEKGVEVIAVDMDRDRVEEVKNTASEAVSFDSTNEQALKDLGLESLDVAVVAIGENIESSILTTALLKRLSISRVVARAITPLHGQILTDFDQPVADLTHPRRLRVLGQHFAQVRQVRLGRFDCFLRRHTSL